MILYFSGTGNGLQIAKQLAQQTNDNLISILKLENFDLSKEETIGFICPVYNYNIPPFIQDILEKIKFNKQAYIYQIVNHGGDIGNTINRFKTILESKDAKLSYANDLKMPVNSRIMYSRITDQIEKRINKANIKLASIANDINQKVEFTKKTKESKILSLIARYVTSEKMQKRFTPWVDKNLCINCEICAKVCPVKNIAQKGNHAFIESNCKQCMTCMHWCPKTAIHFSDNRRVKTKQQYHNPQTKWTDIAN